MPLYTCCSEAASVPCRGPWAWAHLHYTTHFRCARILLLHGLPAPQKAYSSKPPCLWTQLASGRHHIHRSRTSGPLWRQQAPRWASAPLWPLPRAPLAAKASVHARVNSVPVQRSPASQAPELVPSWQGGRRAPHSPAEMLQKPGQTGRAWPDNGTVPYPRLGNHPPQSWSVADPPMPPSYPVHHAIGSAAATKIEPFLLAPRPLSPGRGPQTLRGRAKGH